MTVAAILQWLELEIDYLEELKASAENELQTLIIEGVQVHLREMNDQLATHTLQRMDEDSQK